MPIRDIALNATEDFPLSTVRIDTGAPTDVASIVVSAYPDNSATQITAGITVSSPDSIAGYANIRVVATIANGYLANTHYTLVITTGTVNSVSVVGMTVGEFTIRKNVPGLVTTGIMQASTSSTAVLASATSFADDFMNGHIIYLVAGTGAGQSRVIDDWTNSSDTAAISPNWITTPSTDTVYEVYCMPPSSTAAPNKADVSFWNGTAVSTPATAGIPDINVKNIDNDAASAAGTVTFPNATLASTTNITAAAGIDISKILGTAISTPATAGILDVNVKNMNNVAGTAITTVKAVQGLTTADTVATATAVTTVNGLAANVITATAIAANAITAAKIATAALPSAKFDESDPPPANIVEINDTPVNGDGAGTPWGP